MYVSHNTTYHTVIAINTETKTFIKETKKIRSGQYYNITCFFKRIFTCVFTLISGWGRLGKG